jgi:hypothetical protein
MSLTDEEFARLRDNSQWDFDDPIVVDPKPNPDRRVAFSVRFKPAELDFLREVALRRGMKLSEFVREAAVAAARQDTAAAPLPSSVLMEVARAAAENGSVATITFTPVVPDRP